MAMAFRGFSPKYPEIVSDGGGFGIPQLPPEVVAAGNAKPRSGFGAVDAVGIIGDALQSFNGGRGTYLPMVTAERARVQDLADAAAQRKAAVDDWIFKQQYGAANPGPTKIEQDVAAWQKLTPEQKSAYQEMHPEYRQGPDGQFYRINIAGAVPSGGALPTFTEDDWNKAGGGAGNSTGSFPR